MQATFSLRAIQATCNRPAASDLPAIHNRPARHTRATCSLLAVFSIRATFVVRARSCPRAMPSRLRLHFRQAHLTSGLPQATQSQAIRSQATLYQVAPSPFLAHPPTRHHQDLNPRHRKSPLVCRRPLRGLSQAHHHPSLLCFPLRRFRLLYQRSRFPAWLGQCHPQKCSTLPPPRS